MEHRDRPKRVVAVERPTAGAVGIDHSQPLHVDYPAVIVFPASEHHSAVVQHGREIVVHVIDRHAADEIVVVR